MAARACGLDSATTPPTTPATSGNTRGKGRTSGSPGPESDARRPRALRGRPIRPGLPARWRPGPRRATRSPGRAPPSTADRPAPGRPARSGRRPRPGIPARRPTAASVGDVEPNGQLGGGDRHPGRGFWRPRLPLAAARHGQPRPQGRPTRRGYRRGDRAWASNRTQHYNVTPGNTPIWQGAWYVRAPQISVQDHPR